MIQLDTLMQIARRTARCSACNQAPDEVATRSAFDSAALEVVVRCHGRTDVFSLRRLDLVANTSGAIGHLVGRLRTLFPDDGHPDMIELLKYNRNPWRFSR